MWLALKIAGIILLAILALLLGLHLYGTTLPERHTASASSVLASPRAKVWTEITDFKGMTRWWGGQVKSIEEETRPDGTRVTWNVDGHGQRIGFVTAEEVKEQKLVRRILDEGLPFGGTWTYTLEDAGEGKTKVTIVEDGFIRPPIFRVVATKMMGLDATMKSYLDALGKHLGAGGGA